MDLWIFSNDIWLFTHWSPIPHKNKRGREGGQNTQQSADFHFTFLVFFITSLPRALFTGIIYLRSHLGKYLSVNSYGNVLCESEERDSGTRFQISIAEDGSGRWALRNESRGYFLGGTPDELKCTAKVPSNTEFWTVHLAARPQVRRRLYFHFIDGISIENAI